MAMLLLTLASLYENIEGNKDIYIFTQKRRNKIKEGRNIQ